MKKISLLAVALALVVLPSCRDKKQESTAQSTKRSTSSRYVQTNMDADDAEIEELDVRETSDVSI